jgi:hypothetical protein
MIQSCRKIHYLLFRDRKMFIRPRLIIQNAAAISLKASMFSDNAFLLILYVLETTTAIKYNHILHSYLFNTFRQCPYIIISMSKRDKLQPSNACNKR